MKHARARDLIPDYLEGDLDVPTRAALDRHLAGCPSCNEEVRSLRGVVGLLRSLPDPTPRIDLADAVMDRISAGEGEPPLRLDRRALRRVTVPRLVGTLAAGLAGAAVVLSFAPEDLPFPTTGEADARSLRLSQNAETPGGPAPASRPPHAVLPPGVHMPPRSTRLAQRAWPLMGFDAGARSLPRPSAFAAGVAPTPDVLELAASSQENEVDRQLDWLASDPAAFLTRTHRLGNDHLIRLARRAARRGVADQLARQLMPIRLPEANFLQARLLLESLSADMSQGRPGLD